MSVQVGPAVARERLRKQLRSLREQHRMRPNSVAEKMFWSTSKLTRIETGMVTIQPVEVEALLKLYDVRDEEQIASLKTLAAVSRARHWWSRHRLSTEYQQFVAYEAEASNIAVVQPLAVPSLLQTPDYARAMSAAVLRKDPRHPEVDARVEIRMDRQKAFFERLRGEQAPTMLAVLDEAVLQRPVSGHEVMRAQLDHLLKLADEPFLSLVVLPVHLGAHAGLSGGFELLEFADPADRDVVFVQSPAIDVLVKDDSTRGYRETVETLLAQGQTGDDALKAVQAIRDALDR